MFFSTTLQFLRRICSAVKIEQTMEVVCTSTVQVMLHFQTVPLRATPRLLMVEPSTYTRVPQCQFQTAVSKVLFHFVSSLVDTLGVDLGNKSRYGGGVCMLSISNATISMSNFTNDTAFVSGGGVCVRDYSMLSAHHLSLSKNSARYGGGIFATNFSSAEVSNSSFQRNLAVSDGGAIEIFINTNISISNSSFESIACSFGHFFSNTAFRK